MGMLRDFATWWSERMVELLPARLRSGQNDTGDAVVVELQPGSGEAPGLRLLLRRGGREAPLGTVVLDPDAPDPASLRAILPARHPATVLLRLPPGMLLERDVTLPRAAEPELSRVLAFEMDRLTPFGTAELYWRWDVAERDAARGRLRVRLSVVPRVALGPAIGALTAARLAPTALTVRRQDGTARRIGLAQPGVETGSGRRRAVKWAAAGCGVLALVAAALPFVRQERALRRAGAEIEALRPALAETEALRRRIAATAAGSGVLATEASRVGNTLDALATLTALLPNDTHLTALSLRERRLTLTGQSASAARLIPLLSASPALREPAFSTPVTRAAIGGGEAFSLRAELAP